LVEGHKAQIYRTALSPNGSTLATPSADKKVGIWDTESGKLLRFLEHITTIRCVAWSPSGQILASGISGSDTNIFLWNAETGKQIGHLTGHAGKINSIAWSPKEFELASSSHDQTIRIWDMNTRSTRLTLEGHTAKVYDIAWSPDGNCLCSGSWDRSVRLWDTTTGREIRILLGHRGPVSCVTWSRDGRAIGSGSRDCTVRIWDAEDGRQTHVLEAHTAPIVSVSFLDNDRLLASLAEDGDIVIWRTDTWEVAAQLEQARAANNLSNLAINADMSIMAAPGKEKGEIALWKMDLSMLRGAEPASPTVHYVNAKAVLVGESGVGKSALAVRMVENVFRMMESTHGAQFWHIPVKNVQDLPANFQAELTLWDLAGQPEYRLTHQLFLDDADAAMLLFDCSDPNDPFHGVPYWAKVLKKQASPHAVKFLVSARGDVSPVTVDDQQINQVLAKYELHKYFATSARLDTNNGVDQLYSSLLQSIHWKELPQTTSPQLFQVIRDFILERKRSGEILISIEDIQREISQLYKERQAKPQEIDTVVALLQSTGLVYRLQPRPDVAFVLTRPECINQYTSSIVQAARRHPQGIGAVAENDVVIGNIPFSGFERLLPWQETIVLHATIELLIQHDLCIREMGLLVFPSQINATRPEPQNGLPRTEVTYSFSGAIETIFASLVVRLSNTDYFRREGQWKNASEFSRDGIRLGFSMRQVEEGTGELNIYFNSGISDYDRITFIRFVTDHLRTKGIDIREEIRIYCHRCGKEVTNREAIDARIENGKLDIPCQYCSAAVLIPKSIEERYRNDRQLISAVGGLNDTANKHKEDELVDIQKREIENMTAEDQMIYILHLSDIHLQKESQAGIYRMQLETDLTQELKVRHLDYLVISGDISNHATKGEYEAAYQMLNSLAKRFNLDPERIVIVPGNHDLNWEDSENAYKFVPKSKMPASLPDGKYIPAGDAGVLICDEELYKKRFEKFNIEFYHRIYQQSKQYPLDYAEQAIVIKRPKDRILFLALNSCWEIDHNFKERKGINMSALTNAIDSLQDGMYKDWLKIAVWHHPVGGKEMMNDEFMQLLTVNGFQICMHGHIHKATENFYKYDDKRAIHIIGAGTFGAPAKEQIAGIPLQYNLIVFDPNKGNLIVNTRKKEDPNGSWRADARWGDLNHPVPEYSFTIKNFQPTDDRGS